MSSILVVESEGLITKLLVDAPEIDGFKIITVFNCKDALLYALRNIPILIIVDFLLPGLDGYDLIRTLRDHPKSMHVPIVVVSPRNSLADKVRALDLGVDSYITSPFNGDELLAHVRRQLRRGQQSFLSPLTRLPGGLQLERAIDYKLSTEDPWSILYIDLDNFKAFNDVYGFLAGNHMILLVSHICQRVVLEHGNADDFVGHIGGDDFLIVTTPDRATILYRQILELYKRESITLYTPDDLSRGSIIGVDRKGRPYQFPLVSLSIGIISDQVQIPHNVNEIGTLAAEAKRNAKQSANNVFHISPQNSRHTPTTANCPPSQRSQPAPSSYHNVGHYNHSLLHYAEEDAFA